MGARAEHPVEHRDRGQVAGPHPNERVPRNLFGLGAVGGPQALPGRMQELLPRLRASGMAEQRVVVAAAQPIVAGAHVHAPALRQIVGGL